ncbi:MAG: regulatory iron-sulfur-containing complex subunit RicT [Deltaproteobacteria bacterium]
MENNKEDIKKDLVAVKYSCEGKIDFFDPVDTGAKKGDKVVVETENGQMMGKVFWNVKDVNCSQAIDNETQKIIRIAKENDFKELEKLKHFEKESKTFCQEQIIARKLPMKLTNVESSLDKNKIVFYFTAECRVDFRELVKDLVQQLKMRIELRQISARQEAKIKGGIGQCGREVCCANTSANLDRVSIKMAKEQGVAINPEKISGICGRLMCCLAYEFETYVDLKTQKTQSMAIAKTKSEQDTTTKQK